MKSVDCRSAYPWYEGATQTVNMETHFLGLIRNVSCPLAEICASGRNKGKVVCGVPGKSGSSSAVPCILKYPL